MDIVLEVMHYIGLVIILWGAFGVYSLIRLFREKDSIPFILFIGLPAILIAYIEGFKGACVFLIILLFAALWAWSKPKSNNSNNTADYNDNDINRDE